MMDVVVLFYCYVTFNIVFSDINVCKLNRNKNIKEITVAIISYLPLISIVKFDYLLKYVSM